MRGHSGNDAQKPSLQQYGAKVEYLCCDHVAIPAYKLAQRQQCIGAFAAGNINIMSARSAQSLQNLAKWQPERAMLHCNVLPISQTMALKAKNWGLKKIAK